MKTIAVIGIGRMGGVHARNLATGKIKDGKLIAVCDTDTEKLKKFALKFPNVKTYATHEELFNNEKPDGVIVATPHYAHIPLVCYALEHGANVLSEKPAAVTVGAAAEGIACADKHKDLLYAIMFNQRTNPMYIKAKELMDSGALGELKRVTLTITDWYRSQHYYDQGEWRASWWGEGGGLLINQCVHQLDILQWLVGMPSAVYADARTKLRNITVENDVVAIMEYPHGARCIFTANGHELKGSNLLEIAGDKGKITIGKKKMVYYSFAKSEKEVNATTKKGYGNTVITKKVYRYGLLQQLKEARVGGQQAAVITRFVAAMEGRAMLVADGREGINALTLINSIYLSTYKGEKVTLPLNAAEYDNALEAFKEKEKEKRA